MNFACTTREAEKNYTTTLLSKNDIKVVTFDHYRLIVRYELLGLFLLSSFPILHGGHNLYSAIPISSFLLTGPWPLLRLSTEVARLSPSTHMQ